MCSSSPLQVVLQTRHNYPKIGFRVKAIYELLQGSVGALGITSSLGGVGCPASCLEARGSGIMV